MNTDKTIIGRYENIRFPEFEEMPEVPAKIDTGAFTSSIHASDVKLVEKAGAKTVLSFTLLDHDRAPEAATHEIDDYTMTTVTNSFGQQEERYTTELTVVLAGQTFKTLFTLADRSQNTFPILIGRRALYERFIVDPDISNVAKEKVLSIFDPSPDDEEWKAEK